MQPTYTCINIWPLFTNIWLLKCLIFYINLSNSIELNTQTKDIFQHTVSLNKYSLCQWSDNSIWQLSYWGFSLLLIAWRNNKIHWYRIKILIWNMRHKATIQITRRNEFLVFYNPWNYCFLLYIINFIHSTFWYPIQWLFYHTTHPQDYAPPSSEYSWPKSTILSFALYLYFPLCVSTRMSSRKTTKETKKGNSSIVAA